MAWISEPVYVGEFNEILRLLHDEKLVREAAFATVRQTVDDGRFTLIGQRFFSVASHFDSFDHFVAQVIDVTHTQHRLSPELRDTVRRRFETHMTADGADFWNPLRVDILRRG